MSEQRRIVDLSSRVMDGDPWHAGNIASLLADVTAAEAAARPIPGAHSIWQIVLHMTGWAEEVRLRVAGAPAGNPAMGDWPRVGPVGQARWEAARAALFTAYRALEHDVARMSVRDLSLPTLDPRKR
ncbi:MAG TPA: DinB family protein, partial [Vicinamibacterales bacterium]|nr:DinB family protein [Vicinamibacterales bacterium]